MALSQDTGNHDGAGVLGFAILGCFVTGFAGLVYAFMHEDVLGIFAAVAAFAIVSLLHFKR